MLSEFQVQHSHNIMCGAQHWQANSCCNTCGHMSDHNFDAKK